MGSYYFSFFLNIRRKPNQKFRPNKFYYEVDIETLYSRWITNYFRQV